MRRIGMLGVAAALVVAGALPATAAKPVAEDVITFTVDGLGGSLTATATAADGVGTVQLSGSATVMADCDGAGLPMAIDWSGTHSAQFDLHPNGSSGTVTVPSFTIAASDCFGNPTFQSGSLTFDFDAGGKAEARYQDELGRVIERTGTGTVDLGTLGTVGTAVSAVRTYGT